jgi:hypothetical protein
MPSSTQLTLTDAQRTVLEHAAQATQGRITWFPDHIKGGARQKTLQGMLHRQLITGKDGNWRLTAQSYEALGLPCPTGRANSKQAQVIALLKRPQGASVEDIVQLTAWQAHTVRGFLSAALKKKLGLIITSSKTEDGVRHYQIQAASEATGAPKRAAVTASNVCPEEASVTT